MNVSPNFDTRLMAWSEAQSASRDATTGHEKHLAEAVGYLAQAVEQLNFKLDTVLAGQRNIAER